MDRLNQSRFDKKLWRQIKADFLSTGKAGDVESCVQLMTVEVYRSDDMSWSDCFRYIPRYYAGPEEDIEEIKARLSKLADEATTLMRNRKAYPTTAPIPANPNSARLRIKLFARKANASADEISRMLHMTQGAEMPDHVQCLPNAQIPFVVLNCRGRSTELLSMEAIWLDKREILRSEILVRRRPDGMYAFVGNLISYDYIRSDRERDSIP